LVAATTQLGVVISLIDLAFGLMAFPTVISSILLAPHVKRAATDYFKRLKDGQFNS
jgi:AGCS family alanine or glycine:cation symporter